ncbi:MptD family putative ECF transporter S component [Brevibacillus sp. NRS-1366]|uniref:MptD family putative ECF transporter S component n=1 Tax=Brevibacillus sp. NRS-1366 TaxID=3233899 RepID=UPI003D20ED7B
MMKVNKLLAKDFITIGLYTILIFFLQTIVNMIMTPFTAVAMPYTSGTSLFVTSLVYMLMAIRVGKGGALFFMAIVQGLIYTLMGAPLMLPFFAIAGLLGELTLLKGNGSQYRNVKRQGVAFGLYGAIYGTGGVMNIYVFGKESLNKLQFSPETIDRMVSYAYSPMWLAIGIGFSFIMAMIGCHVSKKLLNKHFVKAGYIQYN